MINKRFFDNKKEWATAVIIFMASYVFYYVGCKELLAAGFYQQLNIAFDLDQSWYFDMVGRESKDWLFKTAENSRPLNIKHPFIYLNYYLVSVISMLGITENLAVIMLSQLFHSGSLVLSYFIFRSMGRTYMESTALTIGLAGTSTYISSGLVLDTYSIAIFWIAAIFLILCKTEYQQLECPVWLRAFVSIMAIGTTAYLIILVALMEFFLVERKEKPMINCIFNKAIYQQFLRIFLFGIILLVVVYYQVIIDLMQDPIGLLKRTFWAVNRPGEKTGILQVISVFMVFSILAPSVSHIQLPEGISMIDLREMDFNHIAWIALFLMLSRLILKCRKDQKNAVILLFSLFWIIINILFHSSYQDRGSLFLYSGHFILAVYILYSVQIKHHKKALLRLSDYQVLDKLMVYGVPGLLWINNVYLYQEIFKLV